MSTTEKQTATSRQEADIISTLAELDRGRFVIECGRELTRLNEAIRNTNKAGALTIRLKMTPNGMRDGRVNQLEIAADVTASLPKQDRKPSIFYITDSGQLTRDDPEQMEMFGA